MRFLNVCSVVGEGVVSANESLGFVGGGEFGGDGAALGAGAFGASNGDHGTCQLMVSPCWRICSRYLTAVTVELKHFGGSVPPVTV